MSVATYYIIIYIQEVSIQSLHLIVKLLYIQVYFRTFMAVFIMEIRNFMLPKFNLVGDFYDSLKCPLYIILYLTKSINSLTAEFFDVNKVVLLNLYRSLLFGLLHELYLNKLNGIQI